MAVHENDPQPGHYLRQFVRGGPWLPARIWWEMAPRETCDECDGSRMIKHATNYDGLGTFGCWECNGTGEVPTSDDVLRCEIAGEPYDPYAEWTWLAKPEQKITKARYELLMAQRDHDETYDPTVTPAREAVDWMKVRPTFSKGDGR